MAERESKNVGAMSLLPQVDYATPVTPSASPKNFEQIHKSDRSFLNFETATIDDKGYSTGTPFPTENLIEAHDVSGSLSERASSQRLGRRAYAGFGSVATVAGTSGDSGSYTHTFSMLNPQANTDLPVYTYAEKMGEPASSGNVVHDVRYDSLMCETFGLQGDGKGFIMIQTGWRGSGKRTSPSGVGFYSGSYVGALHVVLFENQTHNYFRNTQAALKIYPQASFAGTVKETLCQYRSFNYSHNNNPLAEQGYLGCGKFQTTANPESGAVRGSLPLGEQDASFEFVILVDPAYDPFAKQVAQTVMSVKLSAEGNIIGSTSQKHKMTLSIAKLTYKVVQIDSIDGLNCYRIQAPPLAQGQTMPVTLEVINDVASYTS